MDKWFEQNPEDDEMTSEEIIEATDWTHRDDNTPYWMKLYQNDFEPSEELEGKNNVGVELPKHLKSNRGTGIASN